MSTRQLGEILTISVGTAIAIEALLKEDESLKYEYLYLNIRTLFRNFYGAYEEPEEVKLKELQAAFLDEVQQIKTVVKEQLKGPIAPVFYVCSNKSLSQLFRFAKLKEPTTSKQINYHEVERKVVEYVVASEFKTSVKIFDCRIDGGNSKAIVLTHYPLELLSAPQFRTLDLLESHTGIIKEKNLWNSKLTNPDAYRNLPFNILTLQLIGDNATQFNSMGAKYIKPVLEIAKNKNWSAATTVAKVKFDLEKHYDKLLVNILLEMLSVKLK